MKVWKISLMAGNNLLGSYYEADTKIIGDMLNDNTEDVGEYYIIECKEMSSDKYTNAPEFEGF